MSGYPTYQNIHPEVKTLKSNRIMREWGTGRDLVSPKDNVYTYLPLRIQINSPSHLFAKPITTFMTPFCIHHMPVRLLRTAGIAYPGCNALLTPSSPSVQLYILGRVHREIPQLEPWRL
ncbi:hypothetical protein WG66_010848 [Moniliophthora roreri]|nr:hypothetical protein WG66_010848 [Moniliophthora roreri]